MFSQRCTSRHDYITGHKPTSRHPIRIGPFKRDDASKIAGPWPDPLFLMNE